MAIDDKIRYEKLQYDINREAAEILGLSSDKTDKYEHVTAKEILHPDQKTVAEQSKFTYSSLGKTFKNKWKQLKIKEKNN